VKDAPVDVIVAIKASVPSPWVVHETLYPADTQAFLKFASERCEGYEWTKSHIAWRDVMAAERNCWKVFNDPEDEDEDKESFCNSHTDFATVVAGRVEGDVLVFKGKVSIYDMVALKWRHD
jgi:hypothetical protein